jgi:dTDP-4-dehydrorhamnose reductase
VLDTVRRLRPSALINTAAYTHVDRAEEEPDRCFSVNVSGTHNLARACQELAIPLVQISTDYVFSGPASRGRPYQEDEPTSAENVYARSKLESERVAAECQGHLIVRTCGLYVYRPEPSVRNFAQTMLQLAQERPVVRVVDDQYCTPSYVPHVARAILFLLSVGAHGVYHVVNSGATTWCGFATELYARAGITTPVEPIQSHDYPSLAKRPRFSVLDTAKYHELGGPPLPPWQAGIAEFLRAANKTP